MIEVQTMNQAEIKKLIALLNELTCELEDINFYNEYFTLSGYQYCAYHSNTSAQIKAVNEAFIKFLDIEFNVYQNENTASKSRVLHQGKLNEPFVNKLNEKSKELKTNAEEFKTSLRNIFKEAVIKRLNTILDSLYETPLTNKEINNIRNLSLKDVVKLNRNAASKISKKDMLSEFGLLEKNESDSIKGYLASMFSGFLAINGSFNLFQLVGNDENEQEINNTSHEKKLKSI